MTNLSVIYLCLLLAIGHLPVVNARPADTMFLISGLTGDGSAQVPGNKAVSLSKGRFLPPAAKITTSREGGLELLGGGWTLRLGKNSSFSALAGGIKLTKGALLAKPLRKSAELILSTDGHLFEIYGDGTFLSEAIPDGGLRVIALTGDTWLTVTSKRRKRMKLDPGQRIECDAEGKFGRTVDLDLAELVQTSRLIHLFGNPLSFSRELANVVNKQSKRKAGLGPARVDLFLGVSYLPTDQLSRSKDATRGKIEPNAKSPRNATTPTKPFPSQNGSTQVEKLPVVPGPPIRFPASTAPTSRKSFPGRIFDR